jgi:hypothetical protein
MRVLVMYRNSFFGGDGWTYYPVAIDIADICPVCGGKRGELKNHRFYEDGDWFDVDTWRNPCGHIDSYKNCLIEAGYNQIKPASDIISFDRDVQNFETDRVDKLVEILSEHPHKKFKRHATIQERTIKMSETPQAVKIDNSGWLQQQLF